MKVFHFNLCGRLFRIFLTYFPVFIVLFFWFTSAIPSTFVVIYPRYKEGKVGLTFIIIYYFSVFMILFSYIKVMISDAGKVTASSVEHYFRRFKIKDRPKCEICEICDFSRPERAHHCKRCGYCIIKMDHHCPWINNCVGVNNQWIFQTLLFYSTLTGLLGFYIVVKDLFLADCPDTFCPKLVWYFAHQFKLKVFMIISAIIIFLGCGFLLLTQHMNVKYDRTTIETMKAMAKFKLSGEKDKIILKNSIFENYAEICGYEDPICWLFPCRKRQEFLVNDEILALSEYRV